jgi:hypothetical protein
MDVTLISESGNLKVTKEMAERMLRIQKNMRGRAYCLPSNLELVDGKIVRKANKRASGGATEQETTGCSDTPRE